MRHSPRVIKSFLLAAAALLVGCQDATVGPDTEGDDVPQLALDLDDAGGLCSDKSANVVHFVRADTRANKPNKPLGSRKNPFATLADVQAASGPGDVICVMESASSIPPLDGGIQLQDDQLLIGLGPDVRTSPPNAAAARITNTDPSKYDGDAVRLADGVRVEGLHITRAHRGAVFGLNASGVVIRNNLIEGFNRGVLTDGTMPVLGWVAGIHLVATAMAVVGHSNIEGNVIRDGPHGINLLVIEEANATYDLQGNTITDIAHWQTAPRSSLGSAVQVVGLHDGRVAVTIEDLFVDRVGHGVPASPPVSDSDKIFVVLEHSAQADLTIRDFDARNSTGVGGLFSTGIEVLLGFIFGPGDAMRLTALIEDSDIRDMPSAGVLLVDFSNDADVTLTVRNTVVRNTSGILGWSVMDVRGGRGPGWGQGGRHTVRVEGNELRDAEQGNIGMAFATSFNDASPITLDSWDIEVRNNVMANGGDGLVISNAQTFGGSPIPGGTIGRLSMRAEGNDILGADRWGVRFVNSGTILASDIDLGGGALGSSGNNRIVGSGLGEALVDAMDVVAKDNWWGTAAGPVFQALNGGTFVYVPFLTVQPGGPLPPF